MANPSEWLSFHIYPGEYIDRSEWLIREALPAVADSGDWFYLYYTDEIGAHLRFRLRGADLDADSIEEQLNQAIAELPERDRTVSGPLVTISGMPRSVPSGRVGVRAVEYVADLRTYRTRAVADLAEHGFVASTRLTRAILTADHERRVSRKSLAPYLLCETVRLLPAGSRLAFLEAYADFALNAARATSLKENLAEAGESARKRQVPVLIEPDQVPSDIRESLDRWVAAVAALLEGALGADDLSGDGFRNLMLMDAVHLNSNRLGFNFVDEAYLALLLNAQFDRV